MDTRGTLIRRQNCQLGRARRWAGFSLVELMVAITITAIGLAIAVPNISYVIISNQLTTVSNQFVAALNMAKIEAVRRNTSVQLCAGSNNGSDTLADGCAAAGAGAVVVVENDGTTKTTLQAAPTLPVNVSLSSTSAVRFTGAGLGRKVGDTSPTYTGLVIDLSSSKVKANNHRCIYMSTGSALTTCSYTVTSGGCPTSEPTSCQ